MNLFSPPFHFMQNRAAMSGAGGAGGTGGTVTFDPLNTSTNITRSGGNLVATCGAGAGNGTVTRSTVSHSTGKYKYEFTVTNISGNSMNIGAVNGSYAIDGATAMDGSDNAFSWESGGAVLMGSTFLGNVGPTFGNGDVLTVEIDMDAKLVAFAVNTGSLTTQFDCSIMLTGPIFAAFEGQASGDVITANFGQNAYVRAPSSGYGNW